MQAPRYFTQASSRSGLVPDPSSTLSLPSPEFIRDMNQTELFVISQTADVHICVLHTFFALCGIIFYNSYAQQTPSRPLKPNFIILQAFPSTVKLLFPHVPIDSKETTIVVLNDHAVHLPSHQSVISLSLVSFIL